MTISSYNDVFCIKISTDCTETSKFVREERLSQQFRQLSPKLLLVPHSLIKYGNTKSPVKTGTIFSLIKNYLLFNFQRCTLSTLVNWCTRRIQSEGTLGSKLKRRCTLTAESKFGRSGLCKIFRIASGEIPLRLKYLWDWFQIQKVCPCLSPQLKIKNQNNFSIKEATLVFNWIKCLLLNQWHCHPKSS